MDGTPHTISQPKARVQWLDVLKLIGILEVFVGHYATLAGRSYLYVFTHHVALFFFAAGCAEALNTETHFIRYLSKKVEGLLVPFYLFGLLSIFVVALLNDCGFAEALSPLLGLAAGAIRNRYYMGLWFLTALLMTALLFWFIKKLRSKALILLVCFVCGLVPNPRYPFLPYNVDSVFPYLIYYGLGYVLFPWVRRALFAGTHKGRFLLWCAGLVSLGVSMLVYFQVMPAFPWSGVPVIGDIASVLRTMILIWLWVSLAYLLRNVGFLAALGRETLYACGNEYIATMLVPQLLALAGVKPAFESPLAVYLYCILLLLFIHYALVPVEKPMARFMVRSLRRGLTWIGEIVGKKQTDALQMEREAPRA